VRKTRNGLLHPQSDGIEEWYIKTVEEDLPKVSASHWRDFDARLPFLVLAYRTSAHDTTWLDPS
jgi:hypothetical protein